MNIFVLDLDPKIAARYHVDKHVISQMKEGVQMLCTALLTYDNAVPLNSSGQPYKKAHENHPCTKWAAAGLLNYQWLWDLVSALCDEAEHRFGKDDYHITSIIRNGKLPREPKNFPRPATRTPFPNATNDWLKSDEAWDTKGKLSLLTAIDVYRLYYLVDKRYMTSTEYGKENIHWKSVHSLGKEFTDFDIWTNRGAPEFMGDRFYRQQCEYFGVKPTDLILMSRFPDAPESLKLRKKMERKLGAKTPTGRRGRATKADILAEIRELTGLEGLDGFLKLKMDEMLKVKLALPDITGGLDELPTGRLKKPYVAAVSSIIKADVDFSKMTVAELNEIIDKLS